MPQLRVVIPSDVIICRFLLRHFRYADASLVYWTTGGNKSILWYDRIVYGGTGKQFDMWATELWRYVFVDIASIRSNYFQIQISKSFPPKIVAIPLYKTYEWLLIYSVSVDNYNAIGCFLFKGYVKITWFTCGYVVILLLAFHWLVLYKANVGFISNNTGKAESTVHVCMTFMGLGLFTNLVNIILIVYLFSPHWEEADCYKFCKYLSIAISVLSGKYTGTFFGLCNLIQSLI